jgi:hypothetical protein
MTEKEKPQRKKISRALHVIYFLVQLTVILFLLIRTSETKHFFNKVQSNLLEEKSVLLKFQDSMSKELFEAIDVKMNAISAYSEMGHQKAGHISVILVVYLFVAVVFTGFFIVRK